MLKGYFVPLLYYHIINGRTIMPIDIKMNYYQAQLDVLRAKVDTVTLTHCHQEERSHVIESYLREMDKVLHDMSLLVDGNIKPVSNNDDFDIIWDSYTIHVRGDIATVLLNSEYSNTLDSVLVHAGLRISKIIDMGDSQYSVEVSSFNVSECRGTIMPPV